MGERPTDREVSVEQETADTSAKLPHVVLLGAGASKAALPAGDRHGREVPLMRDIVQVVGVEPIFPEKLRALARTDFEAAYSQLIHTDLDAAKECEARIVAYFSELELPEEPNLYDVLTLSLRDKDAIFTFNWDPFLLQSRIRLARLGLTTRFPCLFFLHGNVMAGFCARDRRSGLIGCRCSSCGEPFVRSPLLFPVRTKNYQDGGLIEREWEAVRDYLAACFMLTIFGYSAPKTDVEALGLLQKGWGDPAAREMEQTEIISRPGANHNALHKTWNRFIHTHHYEIHESFYASWLARHPRRSGEAYHNQYWEAKFIDDNPVPRQTNDLRSLGEWFRPLFEAEESASGVPQGTSS